MSEQATFTHPIEVRFRDLDGLGHINNVVYLSYTEQCRLKWFMTRFPQTRPRDHRVPFILARSEIDYLRPGHLTDALSVSTWVSQLGRKSFTMNYIISCPGKGELARALAVLVWYDYALNKSVLIPAEERAFLSICLVTL